MSLMLLLHVDLNALNALDNNLIFSVGSDIGVLGDGISSLILIATTSEDDASDVAFSFI
jgi:hypothetical protein